MLLYDRLFPLLGFDPTKKSSAVIEEHEFPVVEYSHPRLAFVNTSPRSAFAAQAVHRRKPGVLHQASSRAEVDRLHSELKEIGATIVSAPCQCPEYSSSGHDAVFSKDPEGIQYDVVCHEHGERAAAEATAG